MSDKKTQSIITALRKFLTEGGNISQLKEVSSQVKSLIKHEQKLGVVIITTAFELKSKHKELVQKIIEQKTDSKFTYEFEIDPSIIAGMKIKINDYIIDLSIDSTLKQVVENLKQ